MIVKSLVEPSPIPLKPYPRTLEIITKSPVITFTTINIGLFNMLPLYNKISSLPLNFPVSTIKMFNTKRH